MLYLIDIWFEYFQVNVMELSAEDQVLGYGELGNFSVAGFEMVLNRWSSEKILSTQTIWLLLTSDDLLSATIFTLEEARTGVSVSGTF